MTFAAPDTQSEGGSVKVADLAGHLLIIEPIEYKSEIQTVHGVTDAVAVNIVDLDANNNRHDNVLFFNVALKNARRCMHIWPASSQRLKATKSSRE